MRMWVRSLASLSGLRIWCCLKLWCRMQTWLNLTLLWLWHRLAMAALIWPLAWKLGNFHMPQGSPKKQKKTQTPLKTTFLEDQCPRSLWTQFHCSSWICRTTEETLPPKLIGFECQFLKFSWMVISRIMTAIPISKIVKKSKKARVKTEIVSLEREQNLFKPLWTVAGRCSYSIMVWHFAYCISIYNSLRLTKRQDFQRGLHLLCHLRYGQVCVNTPASWWALTSPKWGEHHSGCSQAHHLTTSWLQGSFCTPNKHGKCETAKPRYN